MNYFDIYLRTQGTNRNQVAETTGMTASSLQRAANAKGGTDRISTLAIKAIAKTINKTPGQVLDELILSESAIATLPNAKHYSFEPTVGHYWTSNGYTITDKKYLESVVSSALEEWLEFDDEEREDDDFSRLAESYLESEEDYKPSTKDGKILSAEEW